MSMVNRYHICKSCISSTVIKSQMTIKRRLACIFKIRNCQGCLNFAILNFSRCVLIDILIDIDRSFFKKYSSN